jgi:hypothetical protein
MGKSCLDVAMVKGWSLVPEPPARIMPFMFLNVELVIFLVNLLIRVFVDSYFCESVTDLHVHE